MPVNSSRARIRDIQKICAELGHLIKAHRRALGFSQEELAYRSGLHRTYITDIERGTRNLSIESMQKLSTALGVSMSEFFVHIEGRAGNAKGANGKGHAVDIIFVEDDPNDAELTIKALRNNNLVNRIHHLRDGAEAVEFLIPKKGARQRRVERRPRLVLLDLKLPKVDGLEVLRIIRQHVETKELPVIVLTHSASEADLKTATELGIESYILKPVDFAKFSQTVPHTGLSWLLQTHKEP